MRIPCQADPWLKIVFVSLDALLQSEGVVANRRQTDWFLELGRKFHVVSHAEVQRKVMACVPRILPEQAEWFVRKRIMRASEALHKRGRQSGSISLHCRKIRFVRIT